jgi:hypothetical protein
MSRITLEPISVTGLPVGDDERGGSFVTEQP